MSDTVCRHRLKEDKKFAPPNILCQKHPHLYLHNYEWMSWVHTNDKNIAMSSLWLPHNRNQWAEWTVFLILRRVQAEENCCVARVESQYFGKMLELLQHYIFNSVISKFPQTDEILSKLFLYSFCHNKDTHLLQLLQNDAGLCFSFFLFFLFCFYWDSEIIVLWTWIFFLKAVVTGSQNIS